MLLWLLLTHPPKGLSAEEVARAHRQAAETLVLGLVLIGLLLSLQAH